MKNQYVLPDGYEIRELSHEEFDPLWQYHGQKIFLDQSPILRLTEVYDADELLLARELNKQISAPYRLRLAVFKQNEFCGWCYGVQETHETFYMQNSAVLPEHRQRGLYSALMNRTVEIVKAKGFQRIYSRHNATNNEVIIPKLKFGFKITSLEISDMYGALVHLTYFTNEIRRKILNYRVGEIHPDKQIKELLRLP